MKCSLLELWTELPIHRLTLNIFHDRHNCCFMNSHINEHSDKNITSPQNRENYQDFYFKKKFACLSVLQRYTNIMIWV